MRFSVSLVTGLCAVKCMRADSPLRGRARGNSDASDYEVLEEKTLALPQHLEFRRTRQLHDKFAELAPAMAGDLSRAAFRLGVTGRAGTGKRSIRSLQDQARAMGFYPDESPCWQRLDNTADDLFPLFNALWQVARRREQFFHVPPTHAKGMVNSAMLPRELKPDDFDLFYSRDGKQVAYKRTLTEDTYGNRVWAFSTGFGRRELIGHKGDMVDAMCQLPPGIYLRLKHAVGDNPAGSLLCLPNERLARLTKKHDRHSEQLLEALARLANVRHRCEHELINPSVHAAFGGGGAVPNLSGKVSEALWNFDIDPEQSGGTFYRRRVRVDGELEHVSGVEALPVFAKMRGRVVVDGEDRIVRRLPVEATAGAEKSKRADLTEREREQGYRVRKISDKDASPLGDMYYAGWFEFDALTPDYPKGVDDRAAKSYMRFEALALANHAIFQKLKRAERALVLLKVFAEKAAFSSVRLEVGKRLSQLQVAYDHEADMKAKAIWEMHTGSNMVDWGRVSAVNLMEVLQAQVIVPMQQAQVLHDRLYGGVGGAGCISSWGIECPPQAELGINQTIARVTAATDEVREQLNSLAGRDKHDASALSPQAIRAHRESLLLANAKARVVEQRRRAVVHRPAAPNPAVQPPARRAVVAPVVALPVTTIAFNGVANTFEDIAVPVADDYEVGEPDVQQAKQAFFATESYLKLLDRIRALQAEYAQYFTEDGQRRGNGSVRRANYALLGRAKAQVLLQQLQRIASARSVDGLKNRLGFLDNMDQLRNVRYQLRLLKDDGSYGDEEVVVNLAEHRHATLPGNYHSSNGFFRGFKRVPKTTRYLQDALSVLSDEVKQLDAAVAPALGVQ